MAVNNYYQLYIEQTYRLVETLTLKFDQIADAYNTKVKMQYGINSVDSLDKTSWKYYQNMSGRYHFSDTEMTITSLDTLETIVFNKENLQLHRATKNAYQYDSRYYRELVSRYPEQELLILAILYNEEEDIHAIIEAKDGQIIFYIKELIEENEYNLLSDLQDWIYVYLDRWVNYAFALSDDLYVTSYLAQLYIQLVPALINLRLSKCKTNEAHSYHVREYLASHGMLDKYLDVMTKEQALFFYRNILYIQRNAGKRDTFEWLIENVMTKRNLPVYEYTMKHKVDEMLPTEYRQDQLSYECVPLLKRKPVNFLNVDAEEFTYTLDQALSKIKPLAPLNEEYQEYKKEEIKYKLIDSESNVIYTKLLESIIDDYKNAVPYTLESILMNHWVYWSYLDKYSAKVGIELTDGKFSIIMSALDAFILYYYCLNQAMGFDIQTLPEVLVQRVLRDTPAAKEEIRSVTEEAYLSETKLDTLLSTRPTIESMISVESFYEEANKVYESTLKQHKLLSLEEYDHHAATMEVATMKLYENRKIKLCHHYPNYTAFLLKYSIDFTEYTKNDYFNLAMKIFQEVTGYKQYDQYSIKKIQKAMIDMFTELSSYSIAFISDVNNSPVELVKCREVKPLKITTVSRDQDFVEEPLFVVDDYVSKSKAIVPYDFNTIGDQYVYTKINDVLLLDLTADVKYIDDPVVAPIEVPDPVFTVLNTSGFYQDIATLTNEQKLQLYKL